jgi:NADPH:quinone reductase-like Zn-dependent oxidoreductase
MKPGSVNADSGATNEPSRFLSDNEVLVAIEHHESKVAGVGKDHSVITFAGKVEATGSSVTAVRSGDRIIVFDRPSHYQQDTTSANKSIVVPSHRAHLIPETYSSAQACSYAAALIIATVLLKQELEISFSPGQLRHPRGRNVAAPTGRRIAIVGGQTNLGAALIQILSRATPPDTRIVFVASMESQEDLFQRVNHLIRLGASFGIDGSLPDLLDHADQFKDQAGIEIMINTVDDPVRTDLLRCLTDGKNIIECPSLDLNMALVDEVIGDMAYAEAWNAMLIESAAEFGRYVEPPDRCVPTED